VVLRIRIQQAPNHSLVLRPVLRGLALKKIYASLAQRERDLHAFFLEDEVLGRR